MSKATDAAAAMTSEEKLFRAVQGDKYGKSPADRGVEPMKIASLFLWDAEKGQALRAGSAIPMARGEDPNQFNKTLHGHQVSEHQVVCYQAKIQEVMEQHAYPYTFKTTDEVPKSLADLGSGLTFVWDARAMRSIRDSAVIDPPQNIIEVDDDLADAMSDVEIIDDGDDEDSEDADTRNSFTPKISIRTTTSSC